MEALGHVGIGLFPFQICRLPPTTKLRRSQTSSPATTICSASRWADRLLSDFNFTTDSSSSTATATATLVSPPPSIDRPERHVPIPIDFYQVLGAETHFLTDGIRRAFEARVSKPPQFGFSDDALISRRQILQAACETLSNLRSRREYNEGLLNDEEATVITDVPWEKVDLFVATPSNIPAESFEVYEVALALVAQAFIGKKPHLLQDADKQFQQLQQAKVMAMEIPAMLYDPRNNWEVDFGLERGLCALLIGKVDECRMWLGLDSEDSQYRNPAIVEFVLENSNRDDHHDLPGLCKLLETWLAGVVFPRFRDTKDKHFKLGDYYDDPMVLSYLERVEVVQGSPLAAAAAMARMGAEHVKASAMQALQKVFPSRYSDGIATEPKDAQETVYCRAWW